MIGKSHSGPVIEHQKEACHCKDYKEQKRCASQCPRISPFKCMGSDLRWMDVEPYISNYMLDSIPRGILPHTAREHRPPYTGVYYFFFNTFFLFQFIPS